MKGESEWRKWREKAREKVKGESGSVDLATLIYSEEEILDALLYETRQSIYIYI